MKKTLLSLAFSGLLISPTFAQNDNDAVNPPEPVEPVEIISQEELEIIIDEAMRDAEEALKHAEQELIEAEAKNEISQEELERAQEELRQAAEELKAVDIDMEQLAIEMAEMEKELAIEMVEMNEEIARELAELNEEMLAMNMDLTGCMTDFKTHRKFQYDLVRELARDGFIAPQDKTLTIEFKGDKVKVNGELIEDPVLRQKYLDMRKDYGDTKGTLRFEIDLGDC